VTFLFTDLEGSTRLWEEHPEAMKPALARHDEILREEIESHRGYVVKTTGDGFHAAFAAAHDAIDAAVAAQLTLGAEQWDTTGHLPVRMGIHSGPAEARDGDYYGTAVNRAARLMAAAHGGQIVVSLATEELVQDHGVELLDLGEHALRDLTRPERVFQVVHPDLPREFARLGSLDAFPGNLPAQLTSFVGRDAELVAVAGALDTARLVTLTGVGGVGKTRLSLQVAAEVLPRFAHGAWFCELAAAVDDDSLVQVVATALGVTPLSGMSLQQSIVEFLRGKRQLVVFDNCEHLLDEVSRLAESILHDCPDVRILASSREGLGVPGEQMVAVRSLQMPGEGLAVGAVAQNESVMLFTERAAAARAGFALEAANAGAVVEICRRLDGIPLAIELAAARVASMNPSDIAAHIDERFRLLTGGRRSGIERHQTLRATVDWSYSLLDATERAVFDRLGVFSGDFDSAAAQAVVTGSGIESWDVLDALGSLVAKSMITIDDSAEGVARYQMLETLRAYARERLDELGESDQWRRRHAEHYAALAEELGPELLGRDEFAVRRRFRADLDNTRAAVTWALDADDPSAQDLGVRIIVAFGYEVTMDRRAGIGLWAEHALRRVQEWRPEERTAVLAVGAQSACARADLPTASTWVDEALEGGVSIDAPLALLPWIIRANVSLFEGNHEDTLTVMARAIEAFDAAGASGFQRSNLRAASAHFRVACGELDGARREAEGALDLAREIGNPSQLAISLGAVGAALFVSDPRAALAALEESLALTDAGASDVVRNSSLIQLATIKAGLGDARGTLESLRDGFEHSVACGDRGNFGALAYGVAPLVEIGQPGLAVTFAAAARLSGPLGGASLETEHRALTQAREELGSDAADALSASVEAMSYDDMVHHLRAELDRAIGST
jgi:predicted ATPase/class 3 adenylate cyclase